MTVFEEKRKLTDLTDAECYRIAQIVTDNIVTSLSRVDRSPTINRIEVFCDDTTEKVDLSGYRNINWLENHSGKWNSVQVCNYKHLFEYLFDIGVLQYNSNENTTATAN